jgi:putative endonuclease
VACRDRTLYVGIAKDVTARVAAHNAGTGARYTRTRTPVRVVYRERCGRLAVAMRREREIKRWSRARKIERLRLSLGDDAHAA